MPRKKSSLPHAFRSEKVIERYFVTQMLIIGIPCIKQFNPYEAGWPDRLVVLPFGKVIWVEFKSTGKGPTALQKSRHCTLEALGHKVFVVSNRFQAESLVYSIKDSLPPSDI